MHGSQAPQGGPPNEPMILTIYNRSGRPDGNKMFQILFFLISFHDCPAGYLQYSSFSKQLNIS